MGLEEDLEVEDVSLNSLIAKTQAEPGRDPANELAALRDVLDTGLFSSRGLSRQGWRHQTYAEYLAAYHLNESDVSLQVLRSIFLHQDGSGRVIPQIREIAAWLAGMNAGFFQLVVRSDPEVLLRGDLAAASPSERALVAQRLLEAYASGEITAPTWDTRQYLDRLNNPELAKIVQPYLSDPLRPKQARIAAIEIIRDCRLAGLQKSLVAIALDPKEISDVRFYAAATVAEIGDSDGRAALRQLAFGPAGDDPQDDLRGYGLIAAWPGHITAAELFSALTAVKAPNYIGSYRRFLCSDVAAHLDSHDIVTAVNWARQHAAGHDYSDPLRSLASGILERALDHRDEPAVMDVLALALFERAQIYADYAQIAAKLYALGDDARRAIARAMFSVAGTKEHGALYLMDICAICPRDIPWLLSELSRATNAAIRQIIAEAISRRLESEDVDTFSAVLTAAHSDSDLWAEIEPLVRPVYSGTPEADRMKSHNLMFLAYEKRKATPPAATPHSLSEIIANNGDETFFKLHEFLYNSKQNRNTIDDPLPGWSQFDDNTRTQILHAARTYLKTRYTPDGVWWKEGRSTLGMAAGYSALVLLAKLSPDSLDLIDDSDWEFWARVVLTRLSNETSLSTRTLLIAKAYARAKNIFQNTLDEMIDGENQRGSRVFVVSNLGEFWNDELAGILRAKIASNTLQPSAFKDVLAQLLKKADPEARSLARAMAIGTIPEAGEVRRRAVFATAELISNDEREWKVIWPVFQVNEKLGVEVLQVVASEHQFSSFATALREEEIADLCIWLCKLGVEKADKDPEDQGSVTPAMSLATWWNALINFLTYKGTTEACRAIEKVSLALPQYAGLKQSLIAARERTRQVTWIPSSPEEVMSLTASRTGARLVVSLHGIRTRGAWQKTVNSDLQKNGFRHELLDYGFFRAVQLAMPWQRTRHVEWFRKEYERLVTDQGTIPSIIAHSFGTYIVAKALEKYDELRFDRIILCGSIVRRDYDWDSLLTSGRVKALLNEYGRRDVWASLASWLIADAGASGARGFQTHCVGVYQRPRPHFRHSDYFYPLNYRENWLPFLSGAEPSIQPIERTDPP